MMLKEVRPTDDDRHFKKFTQNRGTIYVIFLSVLNISFLLWYIFVSFFHDYIAKNGENSMLQSQFYLYIANDVFSILLDCKLSSKQVYFFDTFLTVLCFFFKR